MGTAALLLICASLLAMFMQDLRYRQIHIAWPFTVLFSAVYLMLSSLGRGALPIMLYNAFFFLLTIVILILYMSLKNKTFLNPFKSYFGLGDLMFYLAITPMFLLRDYILFFILSMLFSIALFFGFKSMIAKHNIPLAGFSSLLLLLVIGMDALLGYPQLTLIRL